MHQKCSILDKRIYSELRIIKRLRFETISK